MSKKQDVRKTLQYANPEAKQKALELDYQLTHTDNGDVFLCEVVFNMVAEQTDARAFMVEHRYSDYTMFEHLALDGAIWQLCCINLLDSSKNVQRIRKTMYNRLVLF